MQRLRECQQIVEKARRQDRRKHCGTRLQNLRRCRQGRTRQTQTPRSQQPFSYLGHQLRGLFANIRMIGSAKRFNTRTCLPRKAPQVVSTLEAMVAKGWDVTVFSGHRPRDYNNKQKGAAKNSLHIPCRAVDLKVAGAKSWGSAARKAKWREVNNWLRQHSPGGFGVYCSHWHIDNGRKRTWGGCRRMNARRTKYRPQRGSSNSGTGQGSSQ